MITGPAANLLTLWLTLGLSLLMAALVTALLQPLLLRWLQPYNPAARQRLLWCIALFPYTLGLYGVTLVLTPALCHAFLRLDHAHWLLGQGHFHGLGWQGAGVALLCLLTASRLLTLVRKHIHQRRQAQWLLGLAQPDAQGLYWLDSSLPTAFTQGLLRPKILISRALKQALSETELAIVCRHEAAHRQARDPLRLWLFAVLLSVFIAPARRALLAALTLAIEQQADAQAAQSPGGGAAVAATLLRVSRLALQQQRSPALACGFCTTGLEARIRQLLSPEPGAALPVRGLTFTACGLLVLAVVCAHRLHHSLEALLHFHP